MLCTMMVTGMPNRFDNYSLVAGLMATTASHPLAAVSMATTASAMVAVSMATTASAMVAGFMATTAPAIASATTTTSGVWVWANMVPCMMTAFLACTGQSTVGCQACMIPWGTVRRIVGACSDVVFGRPQHEGHISPMVINVL